MGGGPAYDEHDDVGIVSSMLCGLIARVEKNGLHELIEADPNLVAWAVEHKRRDDYEKSLEAARSQKEEIRKRAKKKLTPKELESLGIR